MSISLRDIRQDPFELVRRLINKLNSLWLKWTYPFASIGKNVSVHYTCELIRLYAREISIGDRVTLAREVWLNVACRDARKQPAIIIEDGCGIGRRSMISARNQIRIGRDTIFGPAVMVIDHNHAYRDTSVPIQHQGIERGGTVHIKEGCWLGFGAAVICTKGELVIGRNCVIGANAVVTRSVPAYSVVAGNPAKIVKQYDPARGMWVRERSDVSDEKLCKLVRGSEQGLL